MTMRRVLHAALMVSLSLSLALGMWAGMPAGKVSAATCASTQNGNWADASTWTDCNGTAPVSGDSVTIRHTITLSAAANIGTGVVTVESGGVLNLSSFALTADTLQINDGGEVQQGGTSGAPSGIINTRSYAVNSTYTFNGTQAGLSGTTHPTYGNLNFSPTPTSGGTFALNLDVRGDLTINLGNSQQIRFATGGAYSRTHAIAGDLNVQNGIVVGSNGTQPAIVNLSGALNVTGGTVRGTNDTGNAVYNIGGDVVLNGGTWELDDGTSTGTFAMVFNGVTQQLGGTGSILVDNLMVYTGTTLTVNQVPTVTGVLINNGTLKQTQTVSNATVNFLTISADKYRGVDIQTPNDLGVVTVTVQGNADSCTNDPTSPAYIKRCFSITPTNNATATLTLWATDAEMNGIDFLSGDEGALYRYVTNQWVEQARVEFGTDTNSYNYVTADVGGFSSFLLGKSGDTPTAVTYASMTSGAALWAPVSLLFLGGAALVLRKRR